MPKAPQVRTSERTAFKRCRQAWWWSYVDQLKPIEEATPLRFGTLIHGALELRYPPGMKRGPHPAETFTELFDAHVAEVGPMRKGWGDDGDRVPMRELGQAMMTGFVDLYGEDDRYEVLASEQTFNVPVRVNGRTTCHYVGTLDGIWRDRQTGDLLVVDWKTAATISVTHLPLDEQAGAYWTFGVQWLVKQGLLKPDQLPRFILYTFMRKAMPPDKPRDTQGRVLNKDGTVSKVQPSPLFHREKVYRDEADRRSVRRRAHDEVREIKLVRDGILNVYKNPGPFTCMGCGYRDMCELHETEADWQSLRDATMQRWEPYAAHEIESEGK